MPPRGLFIQVTAAEGEGLGQKGAQGYAGAALLHRGWHTPAATGRVLAKPPRAEHSRLCTNSEQKPALAAKPATAHCKHDGR